MNKNHMLNLDFNQRVVIATDDIPWQKSGVKGIDLKPLALEDSEIGHLTALVRYQPGSCFSRKERSLGEEMLVLKGSFTGQHADHKTGTYYCSPPNYEHLPLNQQGCVLFLKLNQLSKQETEKTIVNINQSSWLALEDGVEGQILRKNNYQQTMIYKWEQGTQISFPEHCLRGSEMFVIKGDIADSKARYKAGTWLRAPDKLLENGVAISDSVAFIKLGYFPSNK